MITLCMDTSQKFLTLVLLQGDKIIAERSEICLRKQSEYIFPFLIDLCDKVGIKAKDINEVVITKGPGSYTGIRIAMTVAKVLATQQRISLFTLSTLQFYAGLTDDAWVLLDARAKRAYVARYQKGKLIGSERVLPLEEISKLIKDELVLGDGFLIGKEDKYNNPAQAFLDLKPFWQKEEDVHSVVPEYLKKDEMYLV